MKALSVQVFCILCLGATIVCSLHCIVGPDHDADLEFETEGIQTQCIDGSEHCLRLDARLVSLNNNATERPVIVGLCSTLDECLNRPCRDILADYWNINYTNSNPESGFSADYSGGVDNPWVPTFDVRSCVTACCQTDFCNRNATEVLQGLTPATQPTEVETSDFTITTLQFSLTETTTSGSSQIETVKFFVVSIALVSAMLAKLLTF